ncbi:DUF3137 domain-containing protein [Alkalitalea saponilacus]|uniref:DUF3137 domain-containing protein n=1 Tax=Alkalitalea saponilacus TaxID=889453 RepID=A0A1T5F4F2_9BACT|nr:DUF3137 domain-containing protein [Alkalitalea saponilacus]ASB50179.1 hypothetical protein CDL62_14050 [Alkalitalea saponilacus]SKB91063.1 Protein of unknown function [Alkalitalea saponilacus]
MKTEGKSFDEIFEKILPHLKPLEEVRKNSARGILLGGILASISFAMVVVGIILELHFFTFLFVMLIMAGVIILFVNLDIVMRNIRSKFKDVVILGLLEYFYEDVQYLPNQKMSVNLLRKSLLFNHYVYNHEGEDFISCRINSTVVYMSEITTDPILTEGAVFNGIFIAVKFNKRFSSKTVLINRRNRPLLRKVRLNFFGYMKKAVYVKLENIEFNKRFLTIAENQVESRYKLTPALMDKMLNYKKKLNANVSFSFIDNYLYVTIPSRTDLFEPRYLKPINNKEFIQKHYFYLGLLTDVVEDLDLNTRIWL